MIKALTYFDWLQPQFMKISIYEPAIFVIYELLSHTTHVVILQ